MMRYEVVVRGSESRSVWLEGSLAAGEARIERLDRRRREAVALAGGGVHVLAAPSISSFLVTSASTASPPFMSP